MNDSAERYLELVKHDLFSARVEWRLYRSLFGTNEQTVDLLNQISGPTAKTLERVLFERTLLNIRKLNDIPENKRNQTKSVSVEGLSEFFYASDEKLEGLVEDSKRTASFAKHWSDKRIAHSDLEHRNGKATLEQASRAKVDVALDAIATVAKHVSIHYFDTTIVTHPIPPLNDERMFLEALFLGCSAEKEREAMRKEYLDTRNYPMLNKMRDQDQTRFPDWLRRTDPPMDVD